MGRADSHSTEIGFGFPTGKPADGDPWCVALDHLDAALTTQVEVETALDDAEEVLSVGVLVGGDTAVEPADAAVHGFLHASVVGRRGLDDVVELHDDVGADGVLEGDGVFGGEEPGVALV